MKRFLRRILILASWLVLWQVIAWVVGFDVLLPGPSAVLGALWRLAAQGGFWLSIASSLLRVMTGFGLGVLCGCLLAVLAARVAWCRDGLLQPLMSAIKSTPVASFIILALVWIKAGNVPVFTTFLIVLPLVWTNVLTGIVETDPKLLQMAKAFHMQKTEKVTKLYVPSIQPYFTASVTAGLGMAWKAGIAAEVICNPRNSIGAGLYNAKVYLDTEALFAWTATVIILSILLEKLIVGGIRRKEGRGRR